MNTKKITIFLFFAIVGIVMSKAQPVFSTVPVHNGKVVFQQYVYVEKEMSAAQKYTSLNKWGKKKYTGNPSLIGIRFDDKQNSMTVSAKTELVLPENSAGVKEKVIMTYRYDTSITNVGCMLVIRDVTYQLVRDKNTTFPAEETISDSAIASAGGDNKVLKQNIRNSTLSFFNQLYDEMKSIY